MHTLVNAAARENITGCINVSCIIDLEEDDASSNWPVVTSNDDVLGGECLCLICAFGAISLCSPSTQR